MGSLVLVGRQSYANVIQCFEQKDTWSPESCPRLLVHDLFLRLPAAAGGAGGGSAGADDAGRGPRYFVACCLSPQPFFGCVIHIFWRAGVQPFFEVVFSGHRKEMALFGVSCFKTLAFRSGQASREFSGVGDVFCCVKGHQRETTFRVATMRGQGLKPPILSTTSFANMLDM